MKNKANNGVYKEDKDMGTWEVVRMRHGVATGYKKARYNCPECGSVTAIDKNNRCCYCGNLVER